MKTLRLIIIMMMSVSVGIMTVTAQDDRAEVPGDNFSLEGALQLFKKSSSPEEFERTLNSSDSKVNNLDLNGDGMVDYIRVINKQEGNVHIFILQAMLNDRESQDVAVIELEKLENGKAVLQIVGDEDVYGVETIIEPTSEVRTYAGAMTDRTVVNVWTWPVVQYVYDPFYVLWVSPWHWYYRPVWWVSWRPIVYYDYYSYWRPYHVHYSYCYTHRISYAPRFYRPYRTYSRSYYQRHENRIVSYRDKHKYDGRDRDRDRGGYDRGNRDHDRGDGYTDNRGNRDNRGNHGEGNNGNGNGNSRGDRDDKDKNNNGQRQVRNQYTDQKGRDRYDAGVGGRDNDSNSSRSGQRYSTQKPQTQISRPVQRPSNNNSGNSRTQQYRSNENSRSTVQRSSSPMSKPTVAPRSSGSNQQRTVQRSNSGSSSRSNKSMSSPSRGNSSPSKPSKSNGGGKRGRGNN